MQIASLRAASLVLLAIAVGSAMALAACGRDDCDPGSAAATRHALVPADLPVHCESRKNFQVEGRKVALTHVAYGQKMDCPSGCFSSHVCAIEDAGKVLLFYAAWNLEEERPLDLDVECPGLLGRETWPGCQPSGTKHPLASQPSFMRFARDQEGDGPFRWCVDRLYE